MSDSEKWAIWTLGVVGITLAAYIILVALLGAGPVATAAFALLSLTSIPRASRRRLTGTPMDERERNIANKALLLSFRAFWVAAIALFVWTGISKGWNGSVTIPMWMLAQFIAAAGLLMLAVQASATLALYRSGSHA